MKILNRAKSIYSDEYFISEDIKFDLGLMYLRVNNQWRECEELTRSINLDDMTDRQGNKIFASLSEDGKGGDVLTDGEYKFVLSFDGRKYRINGTNINEEVNDYENWEDFKTIGIQE